MRLDLLLIPTLLSVAHYFGLHRTKARPKELEIIHSFSAGFSISYVFLILLPELTFIANGSSKLIWTLILIGFSLFHVSHKIIFRNSQDRRLRFILNSEIHLLTAVLYNFLISFSLVQLTMYDPDRSIIIVFLLIIHTILSEISHAEPHRNWVSKVKIPTIIAFTFLGGLLPIFQPDHFVTAVLYSLTAGTIIYIAIREELPSDKQGKPWMFLSGVITFVVIVNQLS